MKRSPAMATADVVAISHLIVANVLYIVGQFTRAFQGLSLTEPGRDIVYLYLDYPIFVSLEFIFRACANMFGSLPFIGFIGPWFEWFFLESEDKLFRFLHAEFVIVASSLAYGLVAYIFGRIFLLVFGLDDE